MVLLLDILEEELELHRPIRMQFAPQSHQYFGEPVSQPRRAMDAYMAANAQGYQQIRPAAPVAMMDYQRRTPATTTTAKAVPLQHALTESPKES
jgi:hypothetical protein